MNHVRLRSSELDYEKDWIKIFKSRVELRDGRQVNWYTAKLMDSVIVIPIEGDQVYLTKEWRIAWNRYIIGPPAGDLMDCHTERSRVQQVRTELRQEIRRDAKSIRKLGELRLSARSHSTCYAYLATNLFESELPRDEGEYLEVIRMPFKKAYRMFLSGALPTTAYSIAALTLAKEKGVK